MKISAKDLHFSELNDKVRQSSDNNILLTDVLGHRYIASGSSGKSITIEGVPGNALGAYLNGSTVLVKGNAQDATGDTMNNGRIVIEGSSGDATGYAMRGGIILIKGNAGYRAGIHMKAYKEHMPVVVIGGRAGDFLGEYQAGGKIIVLGIGDPTIPVGPFCGTGMHGGKIYIRSSKAPQDLPIQVICRKATNEDKNEIKEHIEDFASAFNENSEELLNSDFFVLIPNTKNPYKQLYTHN